MMQISHLEGKFKRVLKATDRRGAGFSLLEILVVLAIMGMMLSLVSSRMLASIDAAQFSSHSKAAVERVSQYRAEAIILKKAILVAPPQDTQFDSIVKPYVMRPLKLPEGWVVNGGPIFISRNGLCLGGGLVITSPTKRTAEYKFSPPLCKAEHVLGGRQEEDL